MQFCYLFSLLAVAAVSSEVVDFNSVVDNGLARANEFLREHRFTSVHIPQGSFGSHVSFYDSDVLGLDSLKRTNNCTAEVFGRNATFDYHYGFGLYQQSFKLLNINGQKMSAGYRVRDNSIHLYFSAFNIGDRPRCYISLHDLSYEWLSDVDFYSSRPEYDGIDVEDYFEEVVTPFLNKKINKEVVEKAMQVMCKNKHLDLSEHMPLIHLSVLEQIGVPSLL